ncbi:MAG: tRNA (adenosine(37)-N6)-threonylcarbamoyltransferase complex dimerization subunit type 1 TsaB [Clostridiales bacterium]|nr:tRNA (adenosine(37)-N6)-threonylcarbamoyltransferase complex dimerization subunit type 1 TsaB [Clostridiales bacterium]
MRILAVESSAKCCSTAVVEDGRIVSEFYTDAGLTHSQTLMQMVDAVLSCATLSLASIDAIAVARGPGSFTGIRIGIAAVKGLAHSSDIKCYGVSTLEAMAYSFLGEDCTVCAVMDARRDQVYTALFDIRGNRVIRLSADSAVSVVDLKEILSDISQKSQIILVGDGADVYYETLVEGNPYVVKALKPLRYQRAYGVAMAVFSSMLINECSSYETLQPVYLRAPQAERELKRVREI